MSVLDTLRLKIRRGDTAFYRWVKGFIRGAMHTNLPQPALLKPLFRLAYDLHTEGLDLIQAAITYFYREPLFRGRCVEVGKRLRLVRLPEIYGHTHIYIGNDVSFTGKLGIASGRFNDEPKLIIQDRAAIGHGSFIAVNKEVTIEEDVIIANDCSISDSDGHPRQADLRIANAPLQDRDIQPVRICRAAWIGRGVHIGKGVTIGEGAIIGTRSVVISDIPAFCIAMGNPAEVVLRGAGRPSKPNKASVDVS